MKFLKNIFLLLLIFLCYSCGPDISKEKAEVFLGVVIKKYKDKPCFGNIIIKHNKQIDTLKDFCSCAPEKSDVWNYIFVGDVIYKTDNSLIINVVRNGVVKKFDYPSCYE